MSEKDEEVVAKDGDATEYEAAFAEFADGTVAEGDAEDDSGHEADEDESVAAADEAGDDEVRAESEGGDEGDGTDVEAQGVGSAQAEDDAPDPWANAPEELRAEREKLEHALSSERGRQAALQRKAQELEVQLRQVQTSAQQAAAPAQGQIREAMKDPEKFAALKEDFPEIAEGVQELMNGMRQEFATVMNQRLQGVEQVVSRYEQERQSAAVQAEYERIEQKHADWREVVNSAQFDEWLVAQPPAIQAALNSADSADAIFLLDQYKAAVAPAPAAQPPADRKKRLRQAATPAGINRAAPGRAPEIPNDYFAAFDHFAKQQAS